MKHFLQMLLLAFFVVFTTSWACSQNGPTAPTAGLTWTQSTGPGITANCVYRSTGANSTPAPPAIFCSTAPITSYSDLTVARSTTYVYTVTAKAGNTESAYSNQATAAVPAAPSAPVLNTPTETKLAPPDVNSKGLELVATVNWIKR